MSEAVVALDGTAALEALLLVATSDGEGWGAAGKGVLAVCSLCCGVEAEVLDWAAIRSDEALSEASDRAIWRRADLVEADLTGGVCAGLVVSFAGMVIARPVEGALAAGVMAVGWGGGAEGAGAGGGGEGRLLSATTGLGFEGPE